MGAAGLLSFGAPGRRGFTGGLDAAFERSLSRVFHPPALVSVNFDGLLATPKWSHLEAGAFGGLGTHPGRLEAFRTLTFVVIALGVAAVFAAFATLSVRPADRLAGAREGLPLLLPSLVPIAFGYLLVHNLQYVLVNAQLMAPLIGNPVGADWWPIHLPFPFNDSYEVHNAFLPSAFYWYTGVLVIVAAHVLAVFLARRHLARDAAVPGNIRRSEYPWLAAMIGYTMVSLWLIAQPLVTEPGSGGSNSATQTAPASTSSAS